MIKRSKLQGISHIIKKNTDYDISLLEVRKYFPKASFNSAKRHSLHIRVTNVSLEDAKKILKNTSGVLIESIQNTKYSTSYLTHLISFNNIITPIVLSCGEYKVNNKDGLIQKQLTPTKLNIIREYNDTILFYKQ